MYNFYLAIIYKKIWPDMFEHDKNMIADFRCADFEVKVGDQICYQDWNPEIKENKGREYTLTVKGLLKYNSPTRYWSKEELENKGL